MPAEQTTNLTYDQLQQLIQTIVTESKKPGKLEQKKLDEEDRRERVKNEQSLAMAKADEESKINRQMNCSHGTVHPGTGAFKQTWRGQVHSLHGHKPYTVLTCTQCLTQSPKIQVSTDAISNGVNFGEVPGRFTYEDSVMMAKKSWSGTTDPNTYDERQLNMIHNRTKHA